MVHIQLKLLKISAISIVKKLLIDSAKKSITNAIKTASKRTIQKTAAAAGYLIDKKIAGKITSVSKKFSQNDQANNKIEIQK